MPTKKTKAEIENEELRILLELEKQKMHGVLGLVGALEKTLGKVDQAMFASSKERQHDYTLLKMFTLDLIHELTKK